MFDREKIKKGVELILEGIGEDKNREGLLETPDRIARMYEEIFAGMEQTAEEPLSKTFHVDNNEMVIDTTAFFFHFIGNFQTITTDCKRLHMCIGKKQNFCT